MRRILLFVLPLALLFLLAACTSGENSQEVSGAASDSLSAKGPKQITAEEAKEKMELGGVTIVDVRTEEEYAEGHIPNAVLLPNETLEQEAATVIPEKDTVLLVYCRSGRRSREASEKLTALGYENVYDFGGIQDWPYETVSE